MASALIGLLLVIPIVRCTAQEDRILQDNSRATPPTLRRSATACCRGYGNRHPPQYEVYQVLNLLRDLVDHAEWANAVFFHAWGVSPARDHEEMRR